MEKTRRLVLSRAGWLLLCSFLQTNAQASGRYTGTVLDPAGLPVDGATVEVYAFPRDGFCTGEDMQCLERLPVKNGRFQLELPDRGALVVARKPGFAPAWRTFFFSPQTESTGNLSLGEPGTLCGKVVEETGRPVADAEVVVAVASMPLEYAQGSQIVGYLFGKPARELFTARTGEDGEFQIKGFPTNAAAGLLVCLPGKTMREQLPLMLNPNRLPWHAGDRDIRLVLEPAATVAGKIRCEAASGPLPRARIRLLSETGAYFGLGQTDMVDSEADGTFRIENVPAGKYQLRATFAGELVPEWTAEPVLVSVKSAETNHAVDVRAIRGGILEVTALGRNDRKPLPEINIVAFRPDQMPGRYDLGSTAWFTAKMGTISKAAVAGLSGKNGVATFRLPATDYQVRAFRGGGPSEACSVTVQPGNTNRVELVLAPPYLLRGIVRYPEDRPAPGVELRIMGNPSFPVPVTTSDHDGRFEFSVNAQHAAPARLPDCVLARDPARNLAVAEDIDENTAKMELTLLPGVALAGRVRCAGTPVTNAAATVLFQAPRIAFHLAEMSRATVDPGQFEIPALPPGRQYSVYVSAPGFALRSSGVIKPGGETNRVELAPFELKPANLKIVGQVVTTNGMPAPNASVHLLGESPNPDTITDDQGRFVYDGLAEGNVAVVASVRFQSGSAMVKAGDTNVVVKLGSHQRFPFSRAERVTLKGKPLPDLRGIGIVPPLPPAGKPLLVCLLDAEQRPSRRAAQFLAEQHQALSDKGLVIVALQVTAISPETLQTWTNSSPLPFPLGCLTEKSEKTNWATGVASLPWLILCNGEGNVIDEGFSLNELAEKLSGSKD